MQDEVRLGAWGAVLALLAASAILGVALLGEPPVASHAAAGSQEVPCAATACAASASPLLPEGGGRAPGG